MAVHVHAPRLQEVPKFGGTPDMGLGLTGRGWKAPGALTDTIRRLVSAASRGSACIGVNGGRLPDCGQLPGDGQLERRARLGLFDAADRHPLSTRSQRSGSSSLSRMPV